MLTVVARMSLLAPCCAQRQRPSRRDACEGATGVGGEPHVWTLRCGSMELPWWLRTTLFCTYYIHLVRRMLSMTGGVCCDAHKQQYTLRTGCAIALTGMGLVNVCVHVSRGFRLGRGPDYRSCLDRGTLERCSRLCVHTPGFRFGQGPGLPSLL